ncbi:hypothetical protein ES319_A07G201300v1 [Gossypium barbadense]|uniref:Cell differentiation protein rcd1 n=1 Tax=Gossypium barbadense TaxID=3634 RepID=A0A5J5V5W0_GOSBA|nr:hypothetical protein ES319_A07G201300v1 [Gossypium barbadense]
MISGATAPVTSNPPARVRYLIQGLASEETREQSLDVLCKNRLAYGNLAVLLWNSFGTMRVLLKCVASHPNTKIPFIRATTFLNTMNNERSYECLRITSLGVIGSLAKVQDPEVIEYLLSTQIFPSCLRCMEVGKTLSRTVSTFIIYRILLSEKGLKYCFILAERYLSVSQCLGKLVENLTEDDAENLPQLLKNIIGCYLRLSENKRTRPQLSSYFPWKFLDHKYANIIRSDPKVLADLRQLVCNLRTSKSFTIHCTDEPPTSSDSPGLSIP